jgi:ribonuclease BN (tRNA processing enzyme)
MELTILGSGTAALQAERGPSGYLLKTETEILMLDGGTGTLLKCLQTGTSYKEIDRIFYTHLHPDHTIDLIPFLFATKHTPGFSRTKPLFLYGPTGFADFFHRIVALYGRAMIEVNYAIDVQELLEHQLSFEGLTVHTKIMQHADNAIGYRFITNGKTMVYSGDTDMCDEIIELSENADVLVLECSFPDDHKVAGHLTPGEAGRIAALANARHLVLTHIYPPVNAAEILTQCSKQFAGPIEIAKDMMRIVC